MRSPTHFTKATAANTKPPAACAGLGSRPPDDVPRGVPSNNANFSNQGRSSGQESAEVAADSGAALAVPAVPVTAKGYNLLLSSWVAQEAVGQVALDIVIAVCDSPSHIIFLLTKPDVLGGNEVNRLMEDSSFQQKDTDKKGIVKVADSIWAVYNQMFVEGVTSSASMDQQWCGERWSLCNTSVQLTAGRRKWIVVVCNFPAKCKELPVEVHRRLTEMVQAGPHILAGVFGNTGPVLEALCSGKGVGFPCSQWWEYLEQDVLFPLYIIVFAKHKPKYGCVHRDSISPRPQRHQLSEFTAMQPNQLINHAFINQLIYGADEPSWEPDMAHVFDIQPAEVAAGSDDGDDSDDQLLNLGRVSQKKPDMDKWVAGVMQVFVFIGNSRTGKPKTAKRKEHFRKRDKARGGIRSHTPKAKPPPLQRPTSQRRTMPATPIEATARAAKRRRTLASTPEQSAWPAEMYEQWARDTWPPRFGDETTARYDEKTTEMHEQWAREMAPHEETGGTALRRPQSRPLPGTVPAPGSLINALLMPQPDAPAEYIPHCDSDAHNPQDAPNVCDAANAAVTAAWDQYERNQNTWNHGNYNTKPGGRKRRR